LWLRQVLSKLSDVPPRTGVDSALAGTIRSLREEKGVGQEALAHAAGLSVATYARIERAQVNPTWTTIRRIVDALDLTLREFGAAIDSFERRSPSPSKRRPT
jgi:transcriptional regulator with XRE-family HTH domain